MNVCYVCGLGSEHVDLGRFRFVDKPAPGCAVCTEGVKPCRAHTLIRQARKKKNAVMLCETCIRAIKRMPFSDIVDAQIPF